MTRVSLADSALTGPLETDSVSTPVGKVIVVASQNARGSVLLALDFEDYRSRMMTLLGKRFDSIELVAANNPAGVCDRIEQYFAGELGALDSLPVATGGTDFQQQVWQRLRSIPPGSVMTYGELATALNRPKAVRAVGMANSLNPVAIALPCHRVVGANGKLTGYAGGLHRKQWLLSHEGAQVASTQAAQSKPPQKSNNQQLSVFD